MKKLFFAVSALAALSLLAPSAGFAATGTALNQLGLYTDIGGDITATSVNVVANTPFTAFLVITNPVNHAYIEGGANPPPAYERPMGEVSGFECQIIVPTANFFTLSFAFNGNATNIGTAPDWVVGFASPVPVSAGACQVMQFSFMVLDLDPKDIFFGVTSIPSLPGGVMAITDGSIENANLQAVFPSSGDFANPVFGINKEVVATENETWGNVKALYR